MPRRNINRPKPSRTPSPAIRDSPSTRVTKSTAKRKPRQRIVEKAGQLSSVLPSNSQPEKEKPKLDLDHSYVGEIAVSPKPPKPPRHPRWKHEGEPLYDNLPEGWTDSEPDLSEDDLEGQIERCKERIEDNINVATFQIRLGYFEGKKELRDQMIASEPEGLSLPVVERLHSLKRIQQGLERKDKYGELCNVNSIIDAYRSGALGWNPGLVTYWTEGRQICQPRSFDWKEFDQIKKEVDNERSWWIEGLHGPGPLYKCAKFSLPTDNHFMHWKKLNIRLPGTNTTGTLEMMEDSGASMMTIYEDDIRSLLVPKPAAIPDTMIIGVLDFVTSSGAMETPVIKLDVRLNHMGTDMIPWTTVQVSLFEGKFTAYSTPRLGGPLLYYMLFTATAPDNKGRVLVSDDRKELIDMLPDPDLKEAELPFMKLKKYGN
ncbi:uncharacterized protein N7459_001998 [Penicillium hispanicum]|uniref:uncharacterized protein n=1 Tax=Penicillium hispanicum TaxID=1080232 RepID=UPI0025414241|nr:uncharacterized protein N7459_001998 [Penicillium hispanicum]KAJ5591629.1 hypothetical protein N7459_001998 [Penicillium hispanicum]